MTIYPYLQCARLLAAFFCGLALGVLADVVKQLFVLFGVCSPQAPLTALYKRPLPLVKRPVRAPKSTNNRAAVLDLPSHNAQGGDAAHAAHTASNGQNTPNDSNAPNDSNTQNDQNDQNAPSTNAPFALRVTHTARAARIVCAVCAFARRGVRVLLLGLAELLFPVLAALLLLLVSFYYERGAFRFASVPLLLFGLFLWRGKISRRFTRPLSLAVFLLAAGFVYLRTLAALPLVLAFRLLHRFFLLPFKRALEKIHRLCCQKRSARLSARQLEAAKNGLLNVKEKRKEYVEKKQKGARQRLRPHARDPRADRADLHCSADHRL